MSYLFSRTLGRRTQEAIDQSVLLGSLKRQGYAAIQRDFSKQADGNFREFKKWKCKVLCLDRNNPVHYNMLELCGWKAALQKGCCSSWWTTSCV